MFKNTCTILKEKVFAEEPFVAFAKIQHTEPHTVYMLNPLSPNVANWNMIFLWSWTSRTTPRSSATHAPGSGLLSTDALKSKNSKFHQMCSGLKGLI